MALFASGNGWFIAGVFVCWVVACVVGIIHLAISPDTNATLELPNRLRLPRERAGEPRAPDRKAA